MKKQLKFNKKRRIYAKDLYLLLAPGVEYSEWIKLKAWDKIFEGSDYDVEGDNIYIGNRYLDLLLNRSFINAMEKEVFYNTLTLSYMGDSSLVPTHYIWMGVNNWASKNIVLGSNYRMDVCYSIFGNNGISVSIFSYLVSIFAINKGYIITRWTDGGNPFVYFKITRK